jgi:hypothetical protein
MATTNWRVVSDFPQSNTVAGKKRREDVKARRFARPVGTASLSDGLTFGVFGRARPAGFRSECRKDEVWSGRAERGHGAKPLAAHSARSELPTENRPSKMDEFKPFSEK